MSWDFRKTLQLLGIIAFAFAVAFLKDYIAVSSVVEAQSPQRFEFQARGAWTNEGRSNLGALGTITFQVVAVCDTANGNLLYLTGGSQSGPAVVPNGCAKTPAR